MPPHSSGRSRQHRVAIFIATVIALIVAAAYKQPFWPATWIDEGFVTNGAMTLATRHAYGTSSADGVRVVHPTLVANGPGVLIPVAMAMRVGGVGVTAARGTAAVFMVICGLLVRRTATRLANPVAGVAALVLLLAMPREGFLYFGRMALGNVPGLVYVFLGLALWVSAVERTSLALGALAGLLFGLAAVTKAQWSLVLPPALALAWLVHRAVLRRHDTRIFAATALGALAPLLLWYAARWAMQGGALFAEDLGELQETSRWNVLAFDPGRYAAGSLWYLVSSGVAAVWATALGFAVWALRHRRVDAHPVVLPAALAAVWMTWYVVVSVGWPRYAFEGFALSTALAGAAIGRWREIWTSFAPVRQLVAIRVAAVAIAAMLAGGVTAHAIARVRDLATAPDRSAQTFSATLAALVGPGQLVESWEWQLDVLVDRPLHHPDDLWVGRYTAQIFGGVPVRDTYDWRRASPRYLVDGPFSKFTGIYRAGLTEGCCTLVASDGQYRPLPGERRPLAPTHPGAPALA